MEIALDQWNERVRRYLANEICLFALFPRALLLNNIVVVVIIISLQYKTIQNSQIQNSTQDNESVASLSDRVIGIMNRYNAISSNVEERAQQLYFDIEESLQVLRLWLLCIRRNWKNSWRIYRKLEQIWRTPVPKLTRSRPTLSKCWRVILTIEFIISINILSIHDIIHLLNKNIIDIIQ